jgi:hypothetical protein
MRCSTAILRASGDRYSRGAILASPLLLPQCLGQTLAREESTTDTLALSLCDEIRSHGVERAINDGSKRLGHLHWAFPLALILTKVGEVQDQVAGDLKAALTPSCRDRQVDLRWESVGKLMETKSGLVAERPLATRPEPRRDETLFVRRREVYETEDPAPRTLDAPGIEVMLEQGKGEPGFGGLLGREVPGLTGRDLVQAGPVRVGPGSGAARHV